MHTTELTFLADLDKVSAPDEAAKSAYQGYLKQYRACLAEQQVRGTSTAALSPTSLLKLGSSSQQQLLHAAVSAG